MTQNEVLERRVMMRSVNLNKPFVIRKQHSFYFPLWTVSVGRDSAGNELTFGELHRSFDDALRFLMGVLTPFRADPVLIETYRNDDKIEISLNSQAA